MPADKIILFLALAIVAAILGWGVLTMARGGAYNVKYSNRIMRYRITVSYTHLRAHET